MCLVMKLLQTQPEKEMVIEFIKNDDCNSNSRRIEDKEGFCPASRDCSVNFTKSAGTSNAKFELWEARFIREIREFDDELSLPNHDIADLETQMIEGTQLVGRMSSFRMYNYCCMDGCHDQLYELNRSLDRLLDNCQGKTLTTLMK